MVARTLDLLIVPYINPWFTRGQIICINMIVLVVLKMKYHFVGYLVINIAYSV